MEHRRFAGSEDWAVLPGAARFADGSEPLITGDFKVRIRGRILYARAVGDATAAYIWAYGPGFDELWIMPLPNASPRLAATVLDALPGRPTEDDLLAFGFKGGNRRLTAAEVEARNAARNAEVHAAQAEVPRQSPWWYAFLGLLGAASWGAGLYAARRANPDPGAAIRNYSPDWPKLRK